MPRILLHLGTPDISTTSFLRSVNGSRSTAASMPGVRLMSGTDGGHISMVTGPGQIMGGTGFPLSHSVGQYFTTGDGTMTTTMDGSGYRTAPGVPRGSSGAPMTIISAGHRCRLMRPLESTSAYGSRCTGSRHITTGTSCAIAASRLPTCTGKSFRLNTDGD